MRRSGIALAALIFLAGASLWIVSRPWFITWRSEAALSRMLGGDVELTRAEYLGDGRLRLRDLSLRARSIEGPAGEIFSVRMAVLTMSGDPRLDPDAAVLDVSLDGVTLRISEAADELNEFNFNALEPSWSKGDGAVPRVTVNDAVTEMGMHANGRFTLRDRRLWRGMVRPHGSGDGWADLRLEEQAFDGDEVDVRGAAEEGGQPIVVTGRFNPKTFAHELEMNHVVLDEDTFEACPRIVQVWWEEMDLSGRVSRIETSWDGGDEFSLEFVVDDVAMTLPLEIPMMEDQPALWARYEAGGQVERVNRPRMHVRSGRIDVREDQIHLRGLEGEVISASADRPSIPVPFELDVRMFQLPPMDWENRDAWIDRVIQSAPLIMEFRTQGFRFAPSAVPGEAEAIDDAASRPAVEIPMLVARALEQFQLEQWALSTDLRIERVPIGGGGMGTEIRSNGTLELRDAIGSYVDFPYRLVEMTVDIAFKDRRLEINELSGRSPSGGLIRIEGAIDPLTSEPGVALSLTADRLALDADLRNALDDARREVFDKLLDPDVHRMVMRAVEEPDVAERAFLGREPGGFAELDLRIDRQPGKDRRTITTGTVTLFDVRALFSEFPYPIRVEQGALEWERDAIRIVPTGDTPGMPITTAGGGVGWVSGRIELPYMDGKVRAKPDLNIEVRGDRSNRLLLAAIPPTDKEKRREDRADWPGGVLATGAKWLEELAVRAKLDYRARFWGVNVDDNAYEIDVSLSDGTVEPASVIARVLGRETGLSADKWTVRDCTGEVHVTQERIELRNLQGEHPDAAVSATGAIELGVGEPLVKLDIDLDDCRLGDHLLELVPEEAAERFAAIWSQYEPTGTFAAGIAYRGRAGETGDVEVAVRPDELALRLDDEETWFRRTGGQMVIDRTAIGFDELAVAVLSGGEAPGELRLNGRMRFDDQGDTPLQLEGRWEGGRFNSPVLLEMVRSYGGSGLAERMRELRVDGRFGASFAYRSNVSGPERYALEIEPRSLSFVTDGTPVYTDIDDGAAIQITPGRATLQDISGELVGGRFSVGGNVEFQPVPAGALSLSYEGRVMSEQLLAILPDGAKEALEAIEFSEGGPSRFDDASLAFSRLEPMAEEPERSEWRVGFRGRALVTDAGLDAGVRFSAMTGPVDLRIDHIPGQSPRVSIDFALDHARALGQRMEDVVASVGIPRDGRAVELRELRARIGAGVIAADAQIGLNEQRAYEAHVQLVDVPLEEFRLIEAAAPNADSGDPAALEAPESNRRPTGRLYGDVHIGGVRGDVDSRYGRGRGHVMDGALAEIPLTFKLLQMLQFNAPAEGLNYAEANFYVDGEDVVFEELYFEDKVGEMGEITNLTLEGVGALDLETMTLDFRFRSRSGIVGLRELFGRIGDQFAAIVVNGPLGDPDVRLAPVGVIADVWPGRVAADARLAKPRRGRLDEVVSTEPSPPIQPVGQVD